MPTKDKIHDKKNVNIDKTKRTIKILEKTFCTTLSLIVHKKFRKIVMNMSIFYSKRLVNTNGKFRKRLNI